MFFIAKGNDLWIDIPPIFAQAKERLGCPTEKPIALGIKFFGQPSLFLSNMNLWPLILLGIAGVFIGLTIKFFGQRGGLGLAQSQYAQTGGLNYRNVPSILVQEFIALWSGASVGPEGSLVFVTGGLGTFI